MQATLSSSTSPSRWKAAAWPLAILLALALFPPVAAALGLDFYIGFVRRVLVVALAAASLNFIMGFGGMVAFELQRCERSAVAAVLNRLALFTQAVSLGDTDSLACHPASTTHFRMSDEALAAGGIGQGTIRLSIGLEDADDLIDDLKRALKAAEKAGA